MKGLYIGIVGATLLAAGVPAGAAVLYDSAGFESPTYAAGALPGQDSWTGATEYSVVNNAGNAHAGSQYLGVASSAGSAGARRSFAESTGSVVTMTSWFYISSGANHWVDVQLRDNNPPATTVPPFEGPTFMALGFQNAENGFTNDIVYRDAIPGEGTNAYIALGKYTPDTWFKIDAVLDMTAGNWDLYRDGTQIGFALPRRQSAATTVGRLVLDREPSSGTFRVDDMIIGDPVPEPSTGLIAAAMLGGLLGRRRRRA